MSALQIKLFMQNKAKFRKSQMNVNKVLTKDYEKRTLGERGKKQSQTNPNKAKFKKAKMNVTSIITKAYENKTPILAPKKRTQFSKRQKTIQTSLPKGIMKKTAFSGSDKTNPIQTQSNPIKPNFKGKKMLPLMTINSGADVVEFCNNLDYNWQNGHNLSGDKFNLIGDCYPTTTKQPIICQFRKNGAAFGRVFSSSAQLALGNNETIIQLIRNTLLLNIYSSCQCSLSWRQTIEIADLRLICLISKALRIAFEPSRPRLAGSG